MFDDYTLPAKFDIEENNYEFDKLIHVHHTKFADALDYFYSPAFDVMDTYLILNSDQIIVIDGPFISESE